MKKLNYVCMECSYTSPKWLGCCPQCNEWNSLFENKNDNNRNTKKSSSLNIQRLSEITSGTEIRYKTGLGELDRVLGGGLTKDSLVLLAGEPGVGKSTLLMEVCKHLCTESTVLYVSGEESILQVANRSKRLGVESNNLYVLHETCWEEITEAIKNIKPHILILDSIQTTTTSEIQSAAGSVGQVREITHEVMNLCKSNHITGIVIGHINKEGSLAGPKVLEHMVDTVLYFEGDKYGMCRKLRVLKNRFGNTMETGLFEIGENGLRELVGQSFYSFDDDENVYGRSLTCILEGTRPICLELQSLVVENKNIQSNRTSQGMDSKRISMLIAIIDKYFEIPLSYNDIYLNVVGELKIESRDSDLAVIASLISSFKKQTIESELVLMGEVDLAGKVREISHVQMRLRDLEKIGIKKVIMNHNCAKKLTDDFSMQIFGVKNAMEIPELIF